MQAELFSVSQLERHARAMASWHELATRPARGPDRLLARLADNQAVLRATHALLDDALARGRQITPAAEWFVDNFHLIEEQIRLTRRHLPRAYSRELPRLANAAMPDTPRVYDLAIELISHAHGRVDLDNLRAVVRSYQAVQPLGLGELWAVPIMLRLALVENLRAVATSIAAGRREREEAATWAARLTEVAAADPGRLVLALAELVRADPPLTDAFITELATRLQAQGHALAFPLAWLEQRLTDRGQTLDHAFQATTQSQAADQVAIGNSIGSLRFLTATDWRDFVEEMSVVEAALRDDPAGVHAAMDFGTRDRYRHAVEEIARAAPVGEAEVAATAVALARGGHERAGHVGYYLVDRGRRALERAVGMRRGPGLLVRRGCGRARLALYGGAIAAVTAGLTAGAARLVPGVAWWWLVLAAICASQVAVALVNWLATLLVRPAVLPRLDFASGIPAADRTVVAVPALLTDAGEIDALVQAMEVRFLANRDPELTFALLTDFRDAASETTPADDALVTRARAGIAALNARHGDAFVLLHRARRWNPREGVWMGRERKRGKLEDLNAMLRGATDRFAVVEGPRDRLRDVRYVIALDADTALPRDAARLLVATLAHPLNRPRFDAARRRVAEGYAILQPRIGVRMDAAARSRFARLHGGAAGLDPYTRAVSDVYQDVFGEGSFVGKGIYDVDAVMAALGDRLPENRVLSHDLLEGAYARAGLVSDVLLVEDYPASVAADLARRHRWIRGDWQIATWLAGRVPGPGGRRVRNPIHLLSRWKIFDNLRRSLVPIAAVALGLGAAFAPGVAPLAVAAVLAMAFLPGLLAALTGLVRRGRDEARGSHAREVGRALAGTLAREAFTLALLPYDAWLALDAIARTSARVLVTRRRLLEWRTASEAERAARTDLAGSYRAMWIAPLAAAAGGLGLVAVAPGSPAWIAAPLFGAWLVGPALAWWASRPPTARAPRLDAADQTFLHTIARRTWRFFEVFVTAEDHHLPPDNFQDDPPRGVAHRTSPTNIGLALTANLAAYDLGYLEAGALIARTTRTLDTLDRLETYRTHLYNWYDTTTLEPLAPRYVSTVDSGNLAALLLVLAAGLDELARAPIARAATFRGLGHTLDVIAAPVDGWPAIAPVIAALRRELADPPADLAARHATLERIAAEALALGRRFADRGQPDAASWAGALEQQARDAADDLAHLAPWIAVDGSGPRPADDVTLADVAALTAAGAAPAFADALTTAAARAAARQDALAALAARCRDRAEFDYGFLHDPRRHLLSIGYNVTEHRLDASCYDLLASEARLTSYVAIAQGQLPQEHWFRLGRLVTGRGGRALLVSWSGSMFEYLMPLLVMPTYRDTLLDESCRAVIERQIAYGRERGVPWGISESGYHKTDAQLNYQYRAFGVPGTGFKRGLADDLVIAPYASAMALVLAPEAACANLRRLERDGQRGAYGFYEAIDYTPARLPRGRDRVTVRSYMAHHQGMSLLALDHLLAGQPMQRRFTADPALRATELLLQERVPAVPRREAPAPEATAGVARRDDADHALRVFTTPHTPAPEVHLLSNGSYHVAITNAGGGYSRWRDLAVTRWQEDPTCDAWGQFVYLRDLDAGEVWSVAHQPTLERATRYEAIFSQGRAEFRRTQGDLESHVELGVSPEDDLELRRITLCNRGRTPRRLAITSYAEVVLATPAADAAHPAFSNLFVQTEVLAEAGAILCTRRPRSGSERPPWMVHLLVAHDDGGGPASFETSRAAFLGRGRTAVDPAALHAETLAGTAGAVLDPVVAIRRTVALAPDETVRLHLVTGVAATRDGALALVEKYRDRHVADRVLELAWTHAQVVQRRVDATNLEAQLFDRLASDVLYANPLLRAPRSLIARNRAGQSKLWAHGISGDLPIVLVRIADVANLGLVRQVVRAHTYWRLRGLTVDLVIWNDDASGYRQVLQDEILGVIAAIGDAGAIDRPGGVFVRRSEHLAEDDRSLLLTVARVVLSDAAGSLAEQLERRLRVDLPAPLLADDRRPVRPRRHRPAPPPAVERGERTAWNGLGGFRPDGREYVITTGRDLRTPAPWCNVIANPWFGTVVTESGGGYTWCENAHAYRLTPWHNDAVTGASGEALYLRDDDDGHHWSPTPLPATGDGLYETRHGFGYSTFATTERGIASELRVYVAVDAPVKFFALTVRNQSGRTRRLSITTYAELVLGSQRPQQLPFIVTEHDSRAGVLFARNTYQSDLPGRIAFLDCSEPRRTVSGDRTEVVGRNGTLAEPACLARARLSNRVGAALDPCLAMQVAIELADGHERELVFTLGSGQDLPDARLLAARFRGAERARAAFDEVEATWRRTLGAVRVNTPDPTLDVLANGWLVYQVLSARVWGRSGFYQSGGAFGFRDQLQDATALVHAEAPVLRGQILRAAARQFPEGDVQHWWHPPHGRGVRTRISDDYLWLPYATSVYVEALGDTGVLDEMIAGIESRQVKPDEESYYDLPARADVAISVYEHGKRAVRHGLRFGRHGLPLMGTGDWNDGMNLVGEHGQGESVWLGFFLYDVLVRFARLAERHGDGDFAATCRDEAARLRGALDAEAWDGGWYRRAYFDDGTPLGAATSPECQLDSLPQSWAVLSGAAPLERARRALAAVDARLVRRDLDVIQLFDPPFDTSALRPGYVKGYLPGVRENGGQYTHAGVWVAMAFAALGDGDKAWELFDLLNPVRHGDSPEAIARYQVEPYVVAADVYTNPQHAGRGGWTWYTGSAGWMYRLIVEALLGVRLEIDRLRVAPHFPPGWDRFEIEYRFRVTTYRIHVRKVLAGAPSRVVCDGVTQPDLTIPLVDDREVHDVTVFAGADLAARARPAEPSRPPASRVG